MLRQLEDLLCGVGRLLQKFINLRTLLCYLLLHFGAHVHHSTVGLGDLLDSMAPPHGGHPIADTAALMALTLLSIHRELNGDPKSMMPVAEYEVHFRELCLRLVWGVDLMRPI